MLKETLLGLSGQQVFITYSAIILSFLSGVLWGAALEGFDNTLGRTALILSNLFALAAWAALLGLQKNTSELIKRPLVPKATKPCAID